MLQSFISREHGEDNINFDERSKTSSVSLQSDGGSEDLVGSD